MTRNTDSETPELGAVANMKIIILGAGQVGTSMGEILSREDNDVTLVDIDSEKLAGLQDRLDIRTVTGAASLSLIHI